MSGNWSLYLPHFFEMFVNFLVYLILCIFLYCISKKDDSYIEKLVGVIEKILTFGLIPITLILLFLMFTYNGFLTAIAGEIFALFPFVCLIWLLSAIVKYVKVRKTNDIDERKKLKKNLITAVIVTSLEWIMFIFLIAVVVGVLRNMT